MILSWELVWGGKEIKLTPVKTADAFCDMFALANESWLRMRREGVWRITSIAHRPPQYLIVFLLLLNYLQQDIDTSKRNDISGADFILLGLLLDTKISAFVLVLCLWFPPQPLPELRPHSPDLGWSWPPHATRSLPGQLPPVDLTLLSSTGPKMTTDFLSGGATSHGRRVGPRPSSSWL